MARLVLLAVLVLFGPVSFAVVASAQGYPAQTVRFIIPFGPASGTDITARLLADRLTVRWGKPVVVENRPGGDGLVSINAFTGANDDHTLLVAPVATFAVHPFMHEKLPYNAERDLLPIVNVTTIVLSITASAAINVSTLAEFEALVRREPGKYNVAAAAGNSDFLLSGFVKSSGLQVAKIPYRDIMQGPNDLAENRIQLLMSSITIVRALHQAGRVKVLAVTGRKRAPIEPAIPTVSEAGYPQLELESLIGILRPARHAAGAARAHCRRHPRRGRGRPRDQVEARAHRPGDRSARAGRLCRRHRAHPRKARGDRPDTRHEGGGAVTRISSVQPRKSELHCGAGAR